MSYTTHILFYLVLVAHSIYVIIHQEFRLKKKVIYYTFASTIGILSFLPWILVILSRLHQVYSKLH